jgi:hypothetical protein
MHCLHHAVQVRFTAQEWDLLDRLAGARKITVEQLIREELRLAPLQEGTARRSVKRHLSLVRPNLVASLLEDA